MSHPFDALRLPELRRRTSAKWSVYDPDVLPMWIAETDFPLAEPIRRVLAEMVERGDTGYPDGRAHVAAFARLAARRYGWTVDPAHAATVPDVMAGVEYAICRLTEPGDPVAFLTPAYPPFFTSVPATGRSVIAVPMAADTDLGWTIDGDALNSALASGAHRSGTNRSGTNRSGARALLLCNPHNPTGRAFRCDELSLVAELADRHGVPVISDEIHAPVIVDPGVRHVPFGTVNPDSVCVHAASKGWNVPGLKAAVLVAGSTATHARLAGPGLDTLGEHAGIFGVAAAAAAYDEGEPWLADTLDYLAGNHRLLAEALPTVLPGARVSPAQATYLAWLDLRDAGLSGEPADALLHEARVALVPGGDFGAGYRGWARMNLGTSRAIIGEALDRIARIAGTAGTARADGGAGPADGVCAPEQRLPEQRLPEQPEQWAG